MIKVSHISKAFKEKPVLKDLSLTFENGKCNLIIGQSGSGKTVLMKSLVGLHEVDQGEIHFDGREYTKMNFKQRKEIRKEIGMLFQGGALFDSQSVQENVMFPLNVYTNKTAAEKLKRVNFCLERVNLENANALFPSELSGGMVKRVAIARAIAMNPRYLFCDEPNSGLDPQTAVVIDKLIREITLEYNMTTVINTHDMNSVLEIGDHIAYIHQGELWWEGNNVEILKSDNPELNDFVFNNELTKRLK
ncbi:MAG: ATP-binding cassette domain-containing protein [Bacteroidales bacterium]|nr:ATP-binding cassette domain-containing protein [Bacteroidales bacterium]